MVKISCCLLVLLALFSCSSSNSDFAHEYVEEYSNGLIKSIVRWNDENADRIEIRFNEKGDTVLHMIEMDIAFHLHLEPTTENEKIIYLGKKIKYNDTTNISFRFGKNSSYVSEYLSLVNGNVDLENSLYVFINEMNTGLEFKCLGTDINKFSLVLYESSDTAILSGDTIRSNKDQIIFLSNSQISGKKGDAIIHKEIFSTDYEERFFGLHEIPILLSFKREMQKQFGLTNLE